MDRRKLIGGLAGLVIGIAIGKSVNDFKANKEESMSDAKQSLSLPSFPKKYDSDKNNSGSRIILNFSTLPILTTDGLDIKDSDLKFLENNPKRIEGFLGLISTMAKYNLNREQIESTFYLLNNGNTEYCLENPERFIHEDIVYPGWDHPGFP